MAKELVEFELTAYEKSQALWLRLKAHMEARLEYARERNDIPQSEDLTAVLRGEIRCLKKLIALGDDRPRMTGDEDAP